MAGDAVFLSGLASGVDTAAIIDKLMQLERRPLVRLRSQQAVAEARIQVLTDLRSRLESLASAAAALRDAATWADVQAVESSDATKVVAVRTGGAAAGAYSITVAALASADQIRQGAGGATSAGADGVIDITVDGVTKSVSIAAGDGLDTIAAKINGTSGIHVYATVVDGRLYLSGKETGAAKTISVASNTLTDALKLSDATRAASDHTIQAQDASLTVNGVTITSSSNTVTTAIPGVTLTLKTTVPTGSPVTVTVGGPAPSLDAIKAKVQAFVDQYNAVVSFIRQKLEERPVSDPQTSADLAKGVLRGDVGLLSLLSSLRRALTDAFSPPPGSGAYATLADVGLSTGATTGSGTLNADAVAGKAVLDATKLSDALSAHFADVKALFTNATGAYASEGLSQRLDRVLSPWVRGDGSNPAILAARIDEGQAAVDSLAARQRELEARLAQRERALRMQFAAVEAVLQQAQSQSAWLSAQLLQLSKK